MHTKALVLHSGGLDSTVCLAKAMRDGCDVISLGIDYGQRHRIELDFAAFQCKRLGIVRRVLRVEWDKPLRNTPEGRTLEEIRDGISPAFLPSRNAVFLTLAAAEAAGLGAREIWIGVNAVDFSGYPDCRPVFIEAFQKMLDLAAPDAPKIVAPLITMTKPEIAQQAAALDIGRYDTWSCYQPQFGGNGISPCGKCDACTLHDYAWSQQDSINS